MRPTPLRPRRAVALLSAALVLAACGGPPSPPGDPSESAAALGDVAGYVGATCVPCHRPGGPAPFELTTVGDLARRGRTTLNVLRSGYMPPWLPADGDVPLAGDRRPAAGQVERLADWVAGSPPLDDPTPIRGPARPQVDRDLVVAPATPLELPPTRVGRFVRFESVVPAGTAGAVAGAALVDEAGAIGHALVRLESTAGDARGVLHLSPATGPWLPPRGAAWPLAAGDRIVVRAFVLPSARPTVTTPAVALSIRDAAEPALVAVALEAGDVVLPRRLPDTTRERSVTVAADATLAEILPDAHLLCRSLSVRADMPDGTSLTLLDVPAWDVTWQESYRPASPLALPAGTRVTARWTWDNSRANPRNPHDPLIDVPAGPEIGDAGGTVWLSLDPRLY